MRFACEAGFVHTAFLLVLAPPALLDAVPLRKEFRLILSVE